MNVVLNVKFFFFFVVDLKERIVFVKMDVFYFLVLFELVKFNKRGLCWYLVKY